MYRRICLYLEMLYSFFFILLCINDIFSLPWRSPCSKELSRAKPLRRPRGQTLLPGAELSSHPISKARQMMQLYIRNCQLFKTCFKKPGTHVDMFTHPFWCFFFFIGKSTLRSESQTGGQIAVAIMLVNRWKYFGLFEHRSVKLHHRSSAFHIALALRLRASPLVSYVLVRLHTALLDGEKGGPGTYRIFVTGRGSVSYQHFHDNFMTSAGRKQQGRGKFTLWRETNSNG